MIKILTVTLNPAIDVRYNLDEIKIGGTNRIKNIEKTAGGKGINVSRVIRELGGDVLATGIVGGYSGKLFLSKLKEDGIKNNFLETENETRTCIAAINNGTKEITELLEGGKGSLDNYKKFVKKYKEIINEGIDIICASGSISNGINKNAYRILIDEAKKKGIKFILDTSGEALVEGIKEKPFLIKPNQEELEDLIGKKIENIEEIIEAGKKIIDSGVENIIVTLGSDGAIFINKDVIYKATFPKVEIKNTVGSGDSTVGGFAYGLSKGMKLIEIFRLSIACGTTNAMLDTTGSINKELLEEILPKIEIEEI